MAQDAARGDALRKGDAAALATVLSDDLCYTHSDGNVERKADWTTAIADKSLRYEEFATQGVNGSQIAPDIVVLRGRIDQLKYVKGKRGTGKLFFTSVWRSESGTWRMVAMQTAIRPAA